MDAARDAMHVAGKRSPSGSMASSAKLPRQAEPPPLEHALGRLWDELRGLLHDQLLLVSLESQEALGRLVRVLFVAVICVALLLGAWAAAMTAMLMWLLGIGLSIASALAVVVGGTLLLAVGLLWFARQSLREITFPATLRRLANAPLPRSPE
jgi:uncharacterized membrane protein YqjE